MTKLLILDFDGTLGDTRADETLVVGDMPVDIQMGKSAGAKTCAVTYGNASREELEESGADYMIDRFDEILEILRKVNII